MRQLFVFPVLQFVALGFYCSCIPGVFAQSVVVLPNCAINFNFTSAGQTYTYDNRQSLCGSATPLNLTYFTNGTISVVSLAVQDAQDAGGTPGAFTNWQGTVASGVNPSITTGSSSASFTGYYPWIRISLASLTGAGVVSGTLSTFLGGGNTSGGGSSSGCVGTIATPCIVAGPNAAGASPTQSPVLVAGQDSTPNVRVVSTDTSGRVAQIPFSKTGASTLEQAFSCPTTAAITIAGTGTTQIIAAPGGSVVVRVCHILLNLSGASNFQIIEGGGTTCTTPTNLSGAFPGILGIAIDATPLDSIRTNTPGDGVCLVISAAVTGGGYVTYGEF